MPHFPRKILWVYKLSNFNHNFNPGCYCILCRFSGYKLVDINNLYNVFFKLCVCVCGKIHIYKLYIYIKSI